MLQTLWKVQDVVEVEDLAANAHEVDREAPDAVEVIEDVADVSIVEHKCT